MTTSRRLLVLDEHHDTEEVLRAVLEPSGTQVTRVRSWQQLQDYTPNQKGTVLVVHSHDSLEAHPEAGDFSQVPRVLIGRIKKQATPQKQSRSSQPAPCRESPEVSSRKEQQLDDLFEFNDLLHAIDSLWRFTS